MMTPDSSENLEQQPQQQPQQPADLIKNNVLFLQLVSYMQQMQNNLFYFQQHQQQQQQNTIVGFSLFVNNNRNKRVY